MNPRPRVSLVAAYLSTSSWSLLMQVAANFTTFSSRCFFFYDRQIFETDPARQWTAAKGGAVLSGEIAEAKCSLTGTRQRALPPAIGLAIVTMSGTTPKAWEGEDLASAPEARTGSRRR